MLEKLKETYKDKFLLDIENNVIIEWQDVIRFYQDNTDEKEDIIQYVEGAIFGEIVYKLVDKEDYSKYDKYVDFR